MRSFSEAKLTNPWESQTYRLEVKNIW
jgi:hypothetical protein